MSRLRSVAICLAILAAAMATVAQDYPSGRGAFNDPYPLRNYEDVSDGISLRVVGMQRPADPGDKLDLPAEGQEYVVVSVELTCDPDRSENCVVASWDFELAGANGIIYPNLVDEDERAFDLAPNTEASGDVLALIDKDDSDLMLLFYHWPTIPYTFPRVFATEEKPEPGPTIAINATIGIIARVGPSKSLDFTGVFNRGEQLLALGRNQDGSWLEISFGWILAELVDAEGDIMSLPVTGE